MKSERAMERRRFLKGALGAAGLVALSGCDNLTQSSWFPAPLGKSEKPTEAVQRAVTPSDALAKEYGDADIFIAGGCSSLNPSYFLSLASSGLFSAEGKSMHTD